MGKKHALQIVLAEMPALQLFYGREARLANRFGRDACRKVNKNLHIALNTWIIDIKHDIKFIDI